MKKSALILVVLFSSILFSSPLSSDGTQNSKNPELVEQFVSIVISILRGKDYTQFRDNISPEAYVINNNTYESIYEVLGNSSKSKMFLEGEGTKFGFVRLWMPDEKNAYMVLQTKSDDNTKTNWHSILLKMGENNKWQILSWHAS